MINNKKNKAIPLLFVFFCGMFFSIQEAFSHTFSVLGMSVRNLKSNRKVPRFVSLRADKVNARVGPAKKYPIKWVFVRKHYPLKVVREFDTWRLVQDVDGAQGWIHQSLLSGLQTVVANNPKGDFVVLKDSPLDKNYKIVANIENGAILKILKRDKNSVFVISLDGKYKGWLDSKLCWGARV